MVVCDFKFDTKNDPVLQNSSQESSMSSKYDCSWCNFNHARVLKIGIQLNNDILWYVLSQIWYQRWPSPPKLQSGAISVLQVWLCSWYTFNRARDLKIGIQLNKDIWWLFVMPKLIPNITKSSKTPVRNHQYPPNMTMFLNHL